MRRRVARGNQFVYVKKEVSETWNTFTLVRDPQIVILRHFNTLKIKLLKKRVVNFISDFSLAYKMFKIRKHYDAVITNSDRVGNLFALMQAFVRKRIVHIMKDCLRSYNNNPVFNILKRIQLKIESISVARFVVMSSCAVEYFSEFTGIKKHKFVPIHFHSTLKGYDFRIFNGNYLFAGGNGNRDYATLINAAKGLNLKVIIAASDKSLFTNISIPDNVVIRTVTPEQFLQLMAGSKMVVIALKYTRLHSGGEQTYLNA